MSTDIASQKEIIANASAGKKALIAHLRGYIKDKNIAEKDVKSNEKNETIKEKMRADIDAVYECIPGGKDKLDEYLGKGTLDI